MGARRRPLDPILPLSAAAVCGGLSVVAPGCALLAGGLSLWLLRGALAPRLGAVVALVLLASGLRAQWVVSAFEKQQRAARELLQPPQRCSVSGQVSASPTVREGTAVVQARLDTLDCEGRRHHSPLVATLYGGPADLARGDRFEAIVELGVVRLFHNLDLPSPVPSAARRGSVASGSVLALHRRARGRGLASAIDAARAHVRGRIEATFPGPAVAMAKALVLGDGDFDSAQSEAFQRSGLSHLLAVSGSHLVLAICSLVSLANALLRRWTRWSRHRDAGRWAAWLGVGLAPLYADFAGGSGSAWRAAAMLIVSLGARGLGRRASTGRAVGLSTLAAAALQPLIAFDLSFLLSLAATAGLSAMTRITIESPVAASPLKAVRRLHRAATATLAATLPCTPLILMISPGLSLASVAGNLLAGPVGELIALPVCLGHALLAPWPALERGAALVGGGALGVIEQVARATASLEVLFVSVPPPGRWHVAAACVGLAGWLGGARCRWPERRVRAPAADLRRARGGFAAQRARPAPAAPAEAPRAPSLAATSSARPLRAGLGWAAATLCLVGAVELAVRLRSGSLRGAAGPPPLTITALDVGQGDATLVELPDGRRLLVDGGGFVGSPVDPGARVLLPTLRARRLRALDAVVLSHPHPDHFGGLVAVLQRVAVGELWLSGQGLERGAGPEYAALLAAARAREVPIVVAAELCRRQQATPDPHLRVLSPCPDFDPAQSANDNSLVLLVSAHHRALLMGDAERWAEQRLLRTAPGALKADLLKVGHHGSRTSSSPALLAAVRPALATISCGVRNRFGHPHPNTLRHLRQAGIRALRLDQTGAVQWQSDAAGQRVRTARGEHETALGRLLRELQGTIP